MRSYRYPEDRIPSAPFDWGIAAILTGLALAVLVVGWSVVMVGVVMATERACLKAGYREAHVDFTLNRYCVKRVEQTDVVIPLEQVR
jgi:hypothetical protein